MSDMQTLMVNSDQVASIMGVKSDFMMDMRSIEECKVIPEVSQVDAGAATQ